MTDSQWQDLLRTIHGDLLDPLPVGLIVDSPWLPGWAGASMLDYFTDDPTWLRVNLEAATRFDKIMLLPGFWAEFGMCTEPSAFGAKCIWPGDNFPSPGRVLNDYAEIARLTKPNCRTDGLLPFVLRRLERCRPEIEKAGHRIRFATARGPLNIASYLLGHTEFLIGLKTNPEEMHRLLTVITDFLVDWIECQAAAFDSIDGIFLLDDLIGFLREDDFLQFALPYLKRAFGCHPVSVRFLHNDAPGMITARHLAEMGVNLFNYSFQHSVAQMRAAAGPSVALLGNIPPRDVLAAGTPDDVSRAVSEMLAGVDDKRGVIVSCGGGTPPGAPSANIDALRS
ncbi:MAG: uroporphyrinogen decarboxylase family protein [Thermoguttaceae bacterium]